jgi:tetratricopeptide (TPR) repeat protein
VRAYHRALIIRPDSFEANRNLAATYLEMDQPDRALTFAQRAVKLKPDSQSAHTSLGVVHAKLGEHDQAIEQFVTAMELGEPNEHVLLNLIESLGRVKRYREAVNAALTLTRIAPSANAFERLGWAHFKVGEYDKSMQAYQKAVERDPQNWVAWRGVGVNSLNDWLRSNKQDAQAGQRARDAFRKSLQINPRQPKVVRVMSNYGLN